MIQKIKELREGLSKDQKKVINKIWQYYCSNFGPQEDWPQVRIVHQFLDSVERTKDVLNSLGGGIVQEVHIPNYLRYRLTFLGALLTDRGWEMENLLVLYLEQARKVLKSDPVREAISGSELQQVLEISDEQLDLLRWVFRLTSWSHATGGPNWTANIPEEVDQFSDIEAMRVYVDHIATRYYDPHLPISEYEQRIYLTRITQAKDIYLETFSFLSDDRLREVLASDWQEVQEIRKSNSMGRKSIVILCGGILEGMLLDVLQQVEQCAKEAYQSRFDRKPRKFSQWSLGELVDVAAALKFLKGNTVSLSQVLRSYRNLVHPGKQLREQKIITEAQAGIAVNTVQICIEELQPCQSMIRQ
jgi:hypothetical protein